MRKITFYFFMLLPISFYSCDNPQELTNTTIDTDSRFVGVWKYDATMDKDQSMAGITARLSKVEATNETYYFDYLNSLMMFSKKDDSTLIGVDNRFNLHYDSNSDRLILDGFHGAHNEFIKLK